MQVLVVGYGSIGKRHVKNLLNLDNIEKITVCSKIKPIQKEVNDNGKVDFVESFDYLINYQSLHLPVDFAIIANETYKHVDTAILLAERGIHLFIEKPISHNLERVEILKEVADLKKLKIFVAYNLRFLGAIQKIKYELDRGAIGQPYFAQIEVGQYLPNWRPNTDYRKSYSADSMRGGGVSLDLSHEVDYMCYLFGMPKSWKTFKTKVSTLEINSDDLFEGIYQFDNGFICNIHMDYLQEIKKRTLRVVGSEGTISLDMVGKHMEIADGNKRQCLNDESLFDTERTYIDELCHFIDAIKNDNSPLISLDNGITTLKLLEDKCV